MIAQLTLNERQHAILISLVVAICGLLLGLAGRDDPIGIHGALIFVAGVLMISVIGKDYYALEPSNARLAQYYDDPTKAGIVLAMIWVRSCRRRLGGVAIGQSGPDFWRRLVELWPDPACPYHLSDFRLRRQQPDRYLALCPAAHLARPTA